MATSGTFNFNDLQIDDIAQEAYERIGLVSDRLDGLQIKSAENSLNFMLSQWSNRGLNLWTIEKMIMPIMEGQPTYSLPDATVDILELTAAKMKRLNVNDQSHRGTAFASSGNPDNAFDGNPLTSCIQNAPNGNIGWQYYNGSMIPEGTVVWYVGIQSNVNAIYNLAIEYYDGFAWRLAYDTGAESYPVGEQVWYVLPTAFKGTQWRIRETSGMTLDIQEVYFTSPGTSQLLSRISRETYISIPNKTAQSIPSSWYIDRTKKPVLNLWPCPNNTYQYLIYNRQRYVQDIGKLINNVDAPQRFYEALVAGLAARLALKFAPDRYDMLEALADKAYNVAGEADSERVPMRFMPTFMNRT